MTLELLEGAMDYVADYLETNLAAKITDLNSRYSDTLSDVAEYYKGELPQRLPLSPTVCIRGSNFDPTVQRAANMELTHRIDVVVFIGHDEPERRFRMLCRYTLGIVELLHAATSNTYRINLAGKAQLTEMLESPDFLQGFILPITVKTVETF